MASEDKLSVLRMILSFLIPLIGIIRYFVHKKDSPDKAKKAIQMALFGLIAGMIVSDLV